LGEPSALYPVTEDGLALHATIRGYVHDYIALYYPGHAAVVADTELNAMYASMSEEMPGLPALSNVSVLVDVLAEIIWRVTGFHQHVGNVNMSGTSAVMVADHLRKGELHNSVQSATILTLITATTAGMLFDMGPDQYPSLLDDWSHLLLPEARPAFDRFQTDLRALDAALTTRNYSREYTLNDFSPRYTKCSVSS
jgi:hypothetical protein